MTEKIQENDILIAAFFADDPRVSSGARGFFGQAQAMDPGDSLSETMRKQRDDAMGEAMAMVAPPRELMVKLVTKGRELEGSDRYEIATKRGTYTIFNSGDGAMALSWLPPTPCG